MNVITFLYNALRGDLAANAYTALQDAMKDLARRQAEAEYHRIMVNFYAERKDHIDPYVDTQAAWDFADACQKRDEQHDDFTVEWKRVEEAEAKVAACKERLLKLKEKTDAAA